MSIENVFKVAIVGDSNVGKSCLLLQFISNTFQSDHNLTIGIDIESKVLNIDEKEGSSRKVKLQIFDTAGQESFRSITRSYYKGSQIVILVYDVTNHRSFSQLENWLKEVEEYSLGSNPIIVLVGNKCDLKSRHIVKREEAEEFVKTHPVVKLFFETSAKSRLNIDQIFTEPCKILCNNIPAKPSKESIPQPIVLSSQYVVPLNDHVDIKNENKQDKEQKSKKSCC
jgi:Ras-related protein Rab-2A